MQVQRASAPAAGGWYLMTTRGDLALRIRPGMALGEDAAGDLTFEPETVTLLFDIDGDGGLLVSAGTAACELRGGDGTRAARVVLPAGARADIVLSCNRITVDTDLSGHPEEARHEIHCVPVSAPPVSATAPSTAPPAAAGEPLVSGRGAETAPEPVATSSRLEAWAAAAGVALGVLGVVILVAPPLQAPDDAQAAGTAAATVDGPGAGAAHTGLRLPLDVESLFPPGARADEATIDFALRSLVALRAAYPDDPQIHRELATLTERLLQQARSGLDSGDPELANRLAFKAARTGVAPDEVRAVLAAIATALASRQAAPASAVPAPAAATTQSAPPAAGKPSGTRPAPVPPATAFAVRRVDPPLVRKRLLPPVDGIAGPGSGGGAAATEPAARIAVLESVGRLAADSAAGLAVERDLRTAALALIRDALITPDDNNALDLYQRVLAARPGSATAQAGIASIRRKLLHRVPAAMAAGDLAGAGRALDGARRAGVDPAVVQGLRDELDYRQALLDARLGRPGSLYPLSELTPTRQVPPPYPDLAPRGARGTVELEFTVTPAGTVADLQQIGDAPGYFAAAAMRAVRQWRFEPVMQDSTYVPVRTAVKVTFAP